LDLTNYLSPVFRLRFAVSSGWGTPRWLIDDVEVREGACRLADWCLLESPDSTVAMAGSPTETIYGQVFESGITNPPGQGQGIVAQLGYGSDGVLPMDASWTWVPATYDSDVGNNDRYRGNLTLTSEGTYDFAYRFLVVGQDSAWTYADLDSNDLGSGGSNGYSAAKAGHLVVTALCDISVSPESLHWCLLPGDSASSFLAIVNSGNGTLTFQIMESQESQANYGEQADSLLMPMWDIPWLREEPTSGTVAPGDTVFVQVFVRAPASPDTVGSHLVVLSNDPDESPIVVGVSIWAQVGVPETQAPVFSRLNQNVPNPFNPVTMIRFSVAEAGMVNLKVFDVSGRPVRTLVEGWTEPRYYEVVWDGRDDKGNLLASGVYLYKLEAPGYVETRKMLLLK